MFDTSNILMSCKILNTIYIDNKYKQINQQSNCIYVLELFSFTWSYEPFPHRCYN